MASADYTAGMTVWEDGDQAMPQRTRPDLVRAGVIEGRWVRSRRSEVTRRRLPFTSSDVGFRDRCTIRNDGLYRGRRSGRAYRPSRTARLRDARPIHVLLQQKVFSVPEHL